MKQVYLLYATWHSEYKFFETLEGLYESQAGAEQAAEFLKQEPGYCSHRSKLESVVRDQSPKCEPSGAV